MKTKFLCYSIFILVILAVTMSFVSATSNETNDNLTLDNAEIKSFESIQVEVNKAKENDVVNLEGYYKGSGKEISVSKSLTFSGSNNAVLDADYNSRIFYAPKPVSLTFKDITFVKSSQCAIGTNMMLGQFTIHVINCTFKDNSYLGIESLDDNLIVEDSIFEDNYQAIQCYSTLTEAVINNCTFINNSYVAVQSSNATIANSYFKDNGNKKDGAGALQGDVLKISKTEFINNAAYENGGAIYVYTEGSISISESLFKNNFANYLGGAIYLDEETYLKNITAHLDKCQFINNSASNGAAIYSYSSSLDINNSNFTSNHAEYSIIYSKADSSFNNTNFSGNVNYTIISPKINLINCNSISKTINQWACLDDNLNNSDFIRIVLNKIFVYYKSGKKLTIKVINTKDNSTVGNCKVKVILKAEKKNYTKYLTTDSNGIASFDISRYNVGRYNLFVSVNDSNITFLSVEEIDVALIYEARPIVKAPKVKFKYKKSKYFKVTVKNKKTKKGIKNLRIKLKVFTGKKHKVYKIKTNKKGVAKFNTKKLKRGKHKVIITSANKNYHIYKKSLIRIR